MSDMPIRRKRRDGRLLFHAVACLALACVLLGLGYFGYRTLSHHVQQKQESIYADIMHQKGLDILRLKMQDSLTADNREQLAMKAVSSKKRALKKDIQALFAADTPLDTVIQSVGDTLWRALPEDARQGAASPFDSQAVADMRGEIEQEIMRHQEGLDRRSVKNSLNVKTAHYPLMYYDEALLLAGAVFMALTLWFFGVYAFGGAGQRERFSRRLEPADYLLPFFVGVLVFTLYPIVRVVFMSFQERFKLDGSFIGWGLGNYRDVIFGVPGTSNYFMQGLRNTFLFVVLTVPVTTCLAIVIAYLLNQKLRFSALFQTAYFLPMVTSITAVGLVWRWIFNRNFGILNAVLGLFGVSPINWLLAPQQSLWVMVIFGVWNSLPFTIILLLSGLQNIDETYYTVAKVDGAKPLRIFRRITVPLLAPTIGLVLTINSISAFKVFTETTVLFNGTPGPAYNMYTVVYYIYEMMHQRLEFGRAAAAAIILFLFIFLFTMAQRAIQKKWADH